MLKEKDLRVLRFDADVALGRVIDELRRALGPPPLPTLRCPGSSPGEGPPSPTRGEGGRVRGHSPAHAGRGDAWAREALVRWCELEGIPAKPLHLMGYEEELE